MHRFFVLLVVAERILSGLGRETFGEDHLLLATQFRQPLPEHLPISFLNLSFRLNV